MKPITDKMVEDLVKDSFTSVKDKADALSKNINQKNNLLELIDKAINRHYDTLESKINNISSNINVVEYKESQLSLYHGIRTNRTPEQIKKEGFCKYGTKVDMKNEIMSALRYFGKEKLATIEKGKIRRTT